MITVKKYYSQTCRPCKILTNWLSEIDLDLHGAVLENIDVATLTDEELAQLNISSVPVLTFERNGMEMARKVGLTPVDEIIDLIKYAKEAK